MHPRAMWEPWEEEGYERPVAHPGPGTPLADPPPTGSDLP